MRVAAIRVQCDLCKSWFEEDEATNIVISIPVSNQVMEVDACDTCVEEAPMTLFLREARPVPVPKKPGRKPKPKEAADAGEPVRSIPCGVKGCTFMAKNAGSLSTHQARAHGMRKAAKS